MAPIQFKLTSSGRRAAGPPLLHALTLMVDLDSEGVVHGVIGRLDLRTRRYVFTHFNDRPGYPLSLSGLSAGMVSMACEYNRDVDESPF